MGVEQSHPSLESKGNDSSLQSSSQDQYRDNISRIDANLQQKLNKGINYNMKILIRGKRNVGKSTLCRRLQGQSFQSNYQPTKEIQTSTINWSYQSTIESSKIVKVEVW